MTADGFDSDDQQFFDSYVEELAFDDSSEATLSVGQRRARAATFAVIVIGALFTLGINYYNHYVMPVPVELSSSLR